MEGICIEGFGIISVNFE